MHSRHASAAIIAGLLVVLGGWAVAAQDKYTLKIEDGLAFEG